MTFIKKIGLGVIVSAFIFACSDKGTDKETPKEIQSLCEESGGLFLDSKERCLCGETLCAEGVQCDESDETVCAGKTTDEPNVKPDDKTDEKVDEKPADKTDDGKTDDKDDDGKADEKEVDPAKEPCEKSGGVYDEKAQICQCGEYKCGAGVVCNSSDKDMCADFDCAPNATSCLNGTYQTCSDKGRWSVSQACPGNTSCASETECGECKDGDIKCDDDPETDVGTSKICVKGKWEVQNECANEEGRPVSCLKEASGPSKVCGECRNMPTQQCTNVTKPGASTDLLIGHLYMCEGGKMRGFQKSAEGEITLTEDKYIKCDAGNSCNPDRTACGECCVGRKICKNDGIARKDGRPDGTVGQMYTCVDGVIDANPTPCPNETLCDERTLGQSCGECGITTRWHSGYNCATTPDLKQLSQTCATYNGDGNWTYHGYWKNQNTCTNMCIGDESHGSKCYGKCLLSNNQCQLKQKRLLVKKVLLRRAFCFMLCLISVFW